MGKIFCLMGKSSVGKDSVFGELIKDKNLNLKGIVPYTTRPKRENEVDGREYNFITEKEVEELKSDGKIIEIRTYNTVAGLWHYCTVDDGQIDLNSESYLMISTLEAFGDLKVYFGEERVVPLYLNLDDGVRLKRAIKREEQQGKKRYVELCRRFIADDIDFSLEKLEEAGVEKWYENEKIEICCDEIRRDVVEMLDN